MSNNKFKILVVEDESNISKMCIRDSNDTLLSFAVDGADQGTDAGHDDVGVGAVSYTHLC